MILHHKHSLFEVQKLKCQTPMKSSEDFTFIPIHYQGNDLMVQTPPMFIPFGVQKYSEEDTKEYLNLSFQPNSQLFLDQYCQPLFQTLSKKYKSKFSCVPFVKESEYSQWMRFRILENTQFYNTEKQKIEVFPSKVFGVFIIHLSGLWIYQEKAWFHWSILQGKIYTPPVLPNYAFIDDEDDFIDNDNEL